MGLMSNAFLSNRLCVDCIVLLVRADKPNIDDPVWVVDPHDNTVLVPSDVEHYTPVLKDTCTPELRLHIAWLGPIRLDHVPVPRQRRALGIGKLGMVGPERLQRRDCDYSHDSTIVPIWDLVNGRNNFGGCPLTKVRLTRRPRSIESTSSAG